MFENKGKHYSFIFLKWCNTYIYILENVKCMSQGTLLTNAHKEQK